MAFLDNLRNAMRPYSDEDEEYIENDEELEEEEPEEVGEEESYAPRTRAAVFSRREAKAYTPAAKPEEKARTKFLFAKPRAFDDAVEIADSLKLQRAVLINLEGADRDTERRIVDFLSGAVYALGGKIVRISAHAFALTPSSCDVIGDEVAEFFGAGSDI